MDWWATVTALPQLVRENQRGCAQCELFGTAVKDVRIRFTASGEGNPSRNVHGAASVGFSRNVYRTESQANSGALREGLRGITEFFDKDSQRFVINRGRPIGCSNTKRFRSNRQGLEVRTGGEEVRGAVRDDGDTQP
jgi:hypothetical protein